MVVGIIILALSIVLLIWGLLPARREIRTQPISPTDLHLPTPSTFRFDTVSSFSASLTQPNPLF